MLEKAFNLSTYLQRSTVDLVTACRLIRLFENDMKHIRSEFESEFQLIEREATVLAQTCGITTEFKQHRVQKRKRFHEELAVDDAISDARKKFVVETYSATRLCHKQHS